MYIDIPGFYLAPNVIVLILLLVFAFVAWKRKAIKTGWSLVWIAVAVLVLVATTSVGPTVLNWVQNRFS
jgi:hypothetical protein